MCLNWKFLSLGVLPKPDKLSVCWELLLRLDSIVLTGMISTGEASDLRRLVMDQVVGMADASNDILQKNDAELLAELRHFSDRSKKYKCLLDVGTLFSWTVEDELWAFGISYVTCIHPHATQTCIVAHTERDMYIWMNKCMYVCIYRCDYVWDIDL